MQLYFFSITKAVYEFCILEWDFFFRSTHCVYNHCFSKYFVMLLMPTIMMRALAQTSRNLLAF